MSNSFRYTSSKYKCFDIGEDQVEITGVFGDKFNVYRSKFAMLPGDAYPVS